MLEYRLAPEDPFPAAIHDTYAAYLYLTQPDHEAITLIDDGVKSMHHSAPIDPKDIVLAGDSAGAGVTIAFQLYMRDYVQPSVEPKYEMPPVTILLSVCATTALSTRWCYSQSSQCGFSHILFVPSLYC